MLYVGSRYPAEVKRCACIYTPILHGRGEPLDGVTLRFCVHRRYVVDVALGTKNGPIMPRANKAGEDTLCCMLTAH